MPITCKETSVLNFSNADKVSDELTTIGNNLTKLMLEANIDSKELSTLTGVSVSLLNSLKRYQGNPTLGTLISLAKFFNISIDKFISPNLSEDKDINLIPVYKLINAHERTSAKAGNKIYVRIAMEHSDSFFAIQLDNSSLTPFFDKGSFFIISPDEKYTDGDITIVRINNKYNVIRKVFINEMGPIFQNISFEGQQQRFDHYSVIGVVTKVIHDIRAFK